MLQAIDTELECSNFCSEAQDRLSLSNMPFSGWVVLQLATSALYPQNYKFRPVENKGSIAQSLTDAKIEVLNRTEAKQFALMKALRSVTLFAVGFFTIIPAAVVGTIYHGYKTTNHLYLLLIDNKETNYNWQKVHKHKDRMLHDAAIISVSLIAVILQDVIVVSMINPLSIAISFVVFSGVFATAAFTPIQMSKWFMAGDNSFFLSDNESYAFHKALILRRQFGIVGSNSALLTWNENKDTDFGYDTVFHNLHIWGYFGKLYTEKAQELFDAIDQLQSELPKNCKLSSYWGILDANRIINFLKKNQFKTGFSAEQIENWSQKIFSLNERMQLAKNLIEEPRKRSLPNAYLRPLPLPINKRITF